MAVTFGFRFVLLLHLIRFEFVESIHTCIFSRSELVTFDKDIIDGQMPCRYTLLASNDQDHVDSFRIDVICDERKTNSGKSFVITALKKKIHLNASGATMDQFPVEKDVSIIIPPRRVDVSQKRDFKKVSLNTGIRFLYTPPETCKIIIANNYTGTHDLNGACGNPWQARRDDGDTNRHLHFNALSDKMKHRKKFSSRHSAKLNPKFEVVTSVNGYHNNRRIFLRQRNGGHGLQRNPKKQADGRNGFQNGKRYSSCYSGGFWRANGSVWMTNNCLVMFTCIDKFVTHIKSPGCSEFADCIKVRHGATCRCRPGFVGNGLTCAFLQNKIASKYRPVNHFAHPITPVVPAERLTTLEDNHRVNIRGKPPYSDGRNQRRKPSRNSLRGRRNPNNSIKKHPNKTWRPSKMRLLVNTHKPRGFGLNAPPKFPDFRHDPIAKNVNNLPGIPALVIRNRPHAKNAPNNRHPPRTQVGKMRNRQKMNPKIFGRPSKHFNKNDKSRPHDNVIKPSKKDRNRFLANRPHPKTLDKNRSIDKLPKNNAIPLYPDSTSPLVKNKPGHKYVACKRINNRMICKLKYGIHKNDNANPLNFNNILMKGQIIPLPKIFDNFKSREANKPKTKPVARPNNNDKPLGKPINDIFNSEKPKNVNESPKFHLPLRKGMRKHSPNNKNRVLTNPKRTELGSKRPNKNNTQYRKRPYSNHRRYKPPTRSDMKRVTEIIRSVSGALNGPNNKRFTSNEWKVLPFYTNGLTTTNVRENTTPASTVGWTSAIIEFLNSVSKKTGDGQYSSSSSSFSTPTSNIQHTRTLPTLHISEEQPRFDVNRRVLPKGNINFPSRKGDNIVRNGNRRRKPLADNNSGMNKHIYPTTDGTMNELVVEPPTDRLDVKPIHVNPNIPMIKKKFLTNYPIKHRQQNRPLKNRHQSNTGPKINSLIRRCKLYGLDCIKIRNVTGFPDNSRTSSENMKFIFPFTGSSNSRSHQETTQAVSVLYSTEKIMTTGTETTSVKNDVIEDWKPHQPKTNPESKSKTPRKNAGVQPSSIRRQPGKNENCENVSGEKQASSGLRYKIMKKIKQSVAQIEG